MNVKHDKLFRLVSERTGTPYEDIVIEFKKLSHDEKRAMVSRLRKACKNKVQIVVNDDGKWYPV